jgi:ABC-type transporter Mla subunit MlaD
MMLFAPHRFILVPIIMLAVLAGCGDDDDMSPEEAMANLCTDMSELQAAVQSFDQVRANPNANVDQLRDARDDVNDAMEDVRDSADDVDDTQIDAVNTAYDNLDQAVDDIDDDSTLAEAAPTLDDELQALSAAWDQMSGGLTCQ